MKQLTFLISLTTDDNDYQIEQAKSAEEAARRLGVKAHIIHAGNDAINQSQQLLKAIQSESSRPDAIVFEPVGGTGLPQVARAAVAAGIGWVMLNRDDDYLEGLRKTGEAPAFAITSDHEEIGRIQGRQFGALLPEGGTVLYIQGPSDSIAAHQRATGMFQTKPDNIQIRALKGQWTEESAFRCVISWLRLPTSRQTQIDAVGCQDDSMALGARRAFKDHTTGLDRDRWLRLPFTGCDGLPNTGQAWVQKGILAATIHVPPNTGLAIEMLVKAFKSASQPRICTLTVPVSYPELESLRKSCQKLSQTV